MRAYVFITTHGDARPIVEKIRAIKGVKPLPPEAIERFLL